MMPTEDNRENNIVGNNYRRFNHFSVPVERSLQRDLGRPKSVVLMTDESFDESWYSAALEFTKPSYNIPAFGGWNYADDFPITQCFQSARAAGFLRYTARGERDLYRGSGDLYCCDQGNKAAIAVISSNKKEKSWTDDKAQHWTSGGQQVGQVAAFPRPPKPVDEDLYNISPHQLKYSTSTRKKMLSLFSRCLEPSCRE